MTFDPTTNRTPLELLTHEEQKALVEWCHACECYLADGWQDVVLNTDTINEEGI